MNLTKEYLDQALKKLASKADLEKFATKDELDERFEKQTQALMAFAEAQTSTLARVIAETIDAPMHERFDRLDDKFDTASRRIDTVETKMQRLERALHIKL
jgi:hypothetical protein